MWSGTGRGLLIGLVAMAVFAGCAAEDKSHTLFHDQKKDSTDLSHAKVEDGFDDDTAADFLLPEEREAVRRSGMTGSQLAADPVPDGAFVGPEQPKGPVSRALDTVGKVGVALLQVAVMLGLMIAPLFMA